MSKGILIAIVGGIAVLIGAGVLLMNNSSNSGDSIMSDINSVVKNEYSSTPSTLRELMALGNNQTCTFADLESSSEGTVYMSGGKIRGDFYFTSEDTSFNSHMIVDGENMYTWLDEIEGGYIMSLSKVEDAQENQVPESPNAPKSVDIDKKVDYKCSKWRVDNSKFVVPTDREFIDLDAMMNKATEDSKIDISDQCDVCASLSGEAAEQCRQALSCN